MRKDSEKDKKCRRKRLTAKSKRQSRSFFSTTNHGDHFIETLTDALPCMIGYWDKNLTCRFANKGYQDWFGKSAESIVGIGILELMGERLYTLSEAYIFSALEGKPQCFERTIQKPNGQISHFWINYVPDIQADGSIIGFFSLGSDITALKAAESSLRVAAGVFQNTVEGIFVTDANGTILSVNPAFTKITGYSADEVIGQTPRLLKSGQTTPETHAALWQHITTKGRWEGELWNRRKSGEIYLSWQTITRIIEDSPPTIRYVSQFHDVTEAWQRDENIRRLAFHDALTDLPNRSLLTERLERQMAVATRERRALVVMFLDLDGFKGLNDTFGHDAGDEALKIVADRLQSLVRKVDTVARLGGDEFVIVLDNVTNPQDVIALAEKIVERVNEPMILTGTAACVGVSIGIATFNPDSDTPPLLIQQADRAMYDAKISGRNTFRFASSD